jgi:hypothetical protein
VLDAAESVLYGGSLCRIVDAVQFGIVFLMFVKGCRDAVLFGRMIGSVCVCFELRAPLP